MTIDAKEREGSDITFGGKHSVYTLKMLNDKTGALFSKLKKNHFRTFANFLNTGKIVVQKI